MSKPKKPGLYVLAIFLLLLGMALAFVACGDVDTASNPARATSNLLFGQWQQSSRDGLPMDFDWTQLNHKVEFLRDGTVVLHNVATKYIVLENGQVNIAWGNVSNLHTIAFSENNTQLQMVGRGGTITLKKLK